MLLVRGPLSETSCFLNSGGAPHRSSLQVLGVPGASCLGPFPTWHCLPSEWGTGPGFGRHSTFPLCLSCSPLGIWVWEECGGIGRYSTECGVGLGDRWVGRQARGQVSLQPLNHSQVVSGVLLVPTPGQMGPPGQGQHKPQASLGEGISWV